LLLSCSGPIKTPVGACATAMESFAIAYDTITSGQAKMMVAGACDDLSEESMREFASMKATANSDLEHAKAREPNQMCRPMTSTRSGFMESHGAGVHVLMSGDLAIEMGLPIYSVVGLVHTAMDREGRSVPAPGKGVLSIASETPTAKFSPLLQLPYRRQQMQAELAQVHDWKDATLASLDKEDGSEHRAAVLEEYERMVACAKRKWGTEWWKGHTSISPLRGALATWGLTVDDIAVASCHGTSTKLNDKNESDILNSEMEALGRTEGNPLFVITQKWLTGHPKGPASSWQAGGVIQSMLSGRVPGNRNLDNVDSDLSQFKHLLYTNRTLDVGKVKASCVTSFGFGQAGGQMLLIHPDYFLATMPDEVIDSYSVRRDARCRAATSYQEDSMAGRRNYVEVKTEAPYPSEDTKDWMLRRDRRVDGGVDQTSDTTASDAQSEASTDDSEPLPRRQSTQRVLAQTMETVMSQVGSTSSVGIDVESITNPCFTKDTFLERNYTALEREACGLSSRAYAGLWAGKEAVVKVLGNAGAQLKSAGAPLRDLELLRNEDGTITCNFHGEVADEAARIGVNNVLISLSYAENLAVAAAVAR